MRKILTQLEPANAIINTLRDALYQAVVNAIVQLIRPFMDQFPDGVDCTFCYRFIDSDLMQSIRRIKKVWVDGNDLFILEDEDNGEHRPEDVYAQDDDCFMNETSTELSFSGGDLALVEAIYDQLYSFVIPRLIQKTDQ